VQTNLLLTIIKSTLSKKTIAELAQSIAESGFSIKELIDLTFHEDEQMAFRASWILENIYIRHVSHFQSAAAYFLTKFSRQDNLSSRRHFGKILALMTAKKAPIYIAETINSYNTDELVETVFSWLIDEQVPVAVKSHCLNILANLSSKHTWVKAELVDTMDFLVDKESIAFYAKVKQIRKQLNPRK
jgi:hypothetical protein